VEIDQTPVGKTSTSSPASYLGIFDDIRKLFAMIPEAKARGWAASHFSFNTGKGRCETCGGKGFLKIPMSFLPDATTDCDDCNGMRYNEETLSLLYQGVSIGELLQKTMSEAREILANHKQVRRTLDYVHELGLGYLTLGQPTHTLSGGEAQRLKIATELGSREAVNTLYILDEPTIGLHMVDVDRLTTVLRKLVEKGNTVLVIEHNLDLIAQADHLLELGPGPGEAGGQILFSGIPDDLVISPQDTPTKRSFVCREIKVETALNTSKAIVHADKPHQRSHVEASPRSAV
jgi:excinuclease ABC subunit A